MAKKILNLKRIELFYVNQFVLLKKNPELKQIMSALKAFPHLAKLGVSLKFMSGLEFEKTFSFKVFPQEFTHLRIGFYGQKLNVLFLKDIDIYLPKLQCLVILTPIMADKEVMTQIVDISEPDLLP